METLVVLIVALVMFELAAWRWGVDSTDSLNSAEWARRRTWRGFGR